MVTITFLVPTVEAMQGERDGHAPNGKQKVVVMPVSVAAARMRLPMPIGKHVARRFSMLLKNAAVCVASRVPLASLVPLCPRGSKKGAQLPPLWTTLVAPDPEDAASTILELDERMARLCSKKRMSHYPKTHLRNTLYFHMYGALYNVSTTSANTLRYLSRRVPACICNT